MNKSSANKLATIFGVVAFIIAVTSIALRFYRGQSFDYFHVIFTLGLVAFLISLAGRKE